MLNFQQARSLQNRNQLLPSEARQNSNPCIKKRPALHIANFYSLPWSAERSAASSRKDKHACCVGFGNGGINASQIQIEN